MKADSEAEVQRLRNIEKAMAKQAEEAVDDAKENKLEMLIRMDRVRELEAKLQEMEASAAAKKRAAAVEDVEVVGEVVVVE